jgi:hypothetical protein
LVVSGPALQRERLPCFLVRPGLTILPAFGFVVADGEVLPILRKADA